MAEKDCSFKSIFKSMLRKSNNTTELESFYEQLGLMSK